MQRNVNAAIALVLLAVLFVAINVLANASLRSMRLDLTQERLFTLSEGTRKVIAGIKEPITLTLYYSDSVARNIPSFRTYGQRVRELIEEYANISKGRIRLTVIDPKPFTDDQDDAARLGVRPLPVGADAELYFGLVGSNTTDNQIVIPFFQREKEPFLEYELTRLVYNLNDPKKPTAGLITGHEMNASISPMMRMRPNAPRPWAIVEQIRNIFRLNELEPSFAEVDAGIDILLIVHPLKLDAKTRYAIDQFVLRGGKAIVFIDPFSEIGAANERAAMGRRPTRTPVNSEDAIADLLKAWGVEIKQKKIVGDWAAAQEVNAGRGSQVEIVRYLPWLKISGALANRDDVITATLGPVVVASAGAITRHVGATTTMVPLMISSEQSMLIDVEKVRYGPAPKELIENFKPDASRYIIAARVSGAAKSAFPDGPPKLEKKPDKADSKGGDKAKADDTKAAPVAAPPAKPHLPKSKSDINVIVVADSDMLFDQFWVQTREILGQRLLVPIAANANFLINALENLSGSSDLINLRSRGQSDRPFLVVEELKRAAERRFLKEERDLTKKLQATQKRIVNLQGKAKSEGGALLSKKQRDAIEEAQRDIRDTRKDLRDVQFKLTRDIEFLEARLKVTNIAGVPLLVALIAIILAAARSQRRRRARQRARAPARQ